MCRTDRRKQPAASGRANSQSVSCADRGRPAHGASTRGCLPAVASVALRALASLHRWFAAFPASLAIAVLLSAAGSQTCDLAHSRLLGEEFVGDGAQPIGVLLLRNGNLFRGRISHFGDRYTVLLAANNEVRFTNSEVAFHGATLDDAYRFKRSQLTPGEVNERLNLAEWCLRYGLLRQAAEETTIALRLAPDHPRIPSLEARIELMMRRGAVSTPATPQLATSPTASPSPTTSSFPTASSRTVTAPAVPRVHNEESAAQRGRAADAPATLEQLETLARELPTGTLERFTAVIQPMLVNRCGANNCHGSSGTADYRLLRLSLGTGATRRSTLRNLHATMRYVDRDEPAHSELLTMAARPHGGAGAAALPAGEAAQAGLLRNWVQLAAQSRSTPQPAKIAQGDARPLQSLPAPRPAGSGSALSFPQAPSTDSGTNVESSTANQAGANQAGSVPTAAGPAVMPGPSNSATGSSDHGDEVPGAPRDPFDPEIFNRRYGTAKAP